MSTQRPSLRWHGGKWKLADWIIGCFPQHKVYVEPYGGAASVLLKKPRSYAEIYNDLDNELVNFFKVARDDGEKLKELLQLTPFAREEFILSYKKTDDPIEQARRTVVRSYMGFGSNAHNKRTGFRSNSNRPGSTPAHDWANLPKSYDYLIERLKGIVLENRPAIDVMNQHDSETTLHYVDPPYTHDTRYKGNDYRFEMSDDDHIELSSNLKNLDGFVVLSGYDSPLYRKIYKDWIRVSKNTHADGARKRTEFLWMNEKAYSHQNQLNLFNEF